MKRYFGRRGGFTMVELLIILALLLLLLAFLLPAVARLREASGRAQAMNNQKQISLGLHSFHDSFRKLPPAFDKPDFGNFQIPGSVHVFLLPFVEQDNVFQQYQMNQAEAGNALIPTFVSPMDPSLKDEKNGVQNHAANLRFFADSGLKTKHDADMPAPKATEPGNTTFVMVTDGLSNTVWYATKYAFCGNGGSRYASPPNKITAAFFGQNHAQEKAGLGAKATFQVMPSDKECLCTPLLAQSFEKQGIIAGLADGSVRFLTAEMSAETWNRLLHPTDGLPLGSDF
ncbi:MAG: DUF1559 domain-containing protein [Gemmataceae bacterium]|nr:DUF1559 domain-containing protein [Gemmataceae bacterium]MCI0737988.1 DUF1559 domain-containing protein [Gemmataceae bacterium]